MGKSQPELWRQFVEPIPEEERDDLLEASWKRRDGDDREAGLAVATARIAETESPVRGNQRMPRC